MLQTLQERCHIVNASGDLTSLYTEIVDYYNSGSLEMLKGNQFIEELCKRKRTLWHNYSCELTYLPTTGTPPASGGFWEWEDSNTILWESGIEMATE